jgi:hypothetical protein
MKQMKSRREMLLVTLACASSIAMPEIARSGPSTEPAKATPEDANPILGKWTYRSLISNPDVSVEFNKLMWGAGEMTIEPAPLGELKGRLAFDKDVLELRGTVAYGNATTVRFQGVGIEGEAKSDNWVYDYLGYLAPMWPNGVNQRSAIVGTIVRTLPHSGGQAKAGVVNCWIAVKQDAAR